MRIGSLALPDRPLLLAPMEDVTDVSFRLLCREFGADFAYTEFINADGLLYEAQSARQKLNTPPQDRPLGVQLYGEREASLLAALEMVLPYAPEVVDLNCGCPVRKIASRGAGAGMLRDIPKLLRVVDQMVRRSNVPVTVKTRIGWDESSITIDTLAEQLQDLGVAALTIHGRTRAQLYSGRANWEVIARVKANPRIRIPIIGNGDIIDGASAHRAFNEYGVDGVMVGRATYGRPWIFEQIRYYLEHGEEPTPYGVARRVEIARRHLRLSVEYKGERRGVLEMRRHLACYFKGLPHFKPLRLRLLTCDAAEGVDELLVEVGNTYAGWEPTAEISESPWSELQQPR